MLSPLEIEAKKPYDKQIDIYVQILKEIGASDLEKQPFSLGVRITPAVKFKYRGYEMTLRQFLHETKLFIGDRWVETFTHGQAIPPKFALSKQSLERLLPEIIELFQGGKTTSWERRFFR